MTLTKIRKAVLPVAGLGTRLLPATKVCAKEMLTVVDRPVIQYAVDEARAAGIEDFIFVTAPHKRMLEDHFASFPLLEDTLKMRGKHDMLAAVLACNLPPGTLQSVFQPAPLGLGHAVLCARDLVGDEPFVVMLPDDLFLARDGAPGAVQQLMDAYGMVGGNLLITVDVPREETRRYGVITPGTTSGTVTTIKGMVEKPDPSVAPSTQAIMGRYILQPTIFKHLSGLGAGAGGEIQLTDGMSRLMETEPFHAVRFDGVRYDAGTKLGFIETNLAYALRDPEIRDAVRGVLNRYKN